MELTDDSVDFRANLLDTPMITANGATIMTTLSLPLAPAGEAAPTSLKRRSSRTDEVPLAAVELLVHRRNRRRHHRPRRPDHPITVGSFADWSPAEQAPFDGTSNSLAGLLLGQLAIGVLGVLAITSEYSTGLIRTSLAAVPQRRTFLARQSCRHRPGRTRRRHRHLIRCIRHRPGHPQPRTPR